jgi:alpha-tubulin suppressor-like RCC1 family protein
MLIRIIVYCLVVMTIIAVSMSTLAAQSARLGTRPMAAYEFTSISAGLQHTCALTSVGVIFCWGDNANGQLGNGSFVNTSLPKLVENPTGVTFRTVSASGNHTCALSTTNKAYC